MFKVGHMNAQRSALRRHPFTIALAAFVVAFIAWQVPQFDFLMYPLRLFVTFIHESGHGLAALISGGQFNQMVVFPNGSGLAMTTGGARWLILPAGYLGAAAFGALLFFFNNRFHHSRALSAVIAVMIALMAVLYTNFLSTAFLVGLGFAGVLGLLAWKASSDLNRLVLNVLAILTALNAVTDLFSLVRSTGISMNGIRNDAAAFSAEVMPLIPPVVWALLWAGLALLMLGAAVYYSLIHPLRRQRAAREEISAGRGF